MNERLNRFTSLLKQIFELDKSDLDFGIYRVMNLRKAQIEEFLTERLPQMVQETLAPFAQGSKEEIRAKMKQIEDSVSEMGMTVDALPDTAQKKRQYLQLQKQLAEGADLAALETDVYSALYSFFNRYYEDGDFISKRRYKEGVYAIPYEGEEVKLYWANQDQYYIKTSENFKDYTFVFDGITVHFRLVDATTEQNNNKESKDSKRTFMLFTEDEENYPGIKRFEYDPEAAEIVIRFVYDIPEDKKKKYAEENYAAITAWLLSQHRAELNPLIAPIPTGKGRETTTLLEKHLKGYVAKNTFDYFIHKDLHGFLTRELDFFIKSEVMHLEDLDTGSEARVETYLAKVKAIKRVGKIIIDFLAQIEDFQKKLWLKKKFVVETNWCITLDKIDESFWAEIIGNKAQIDEWIAMYAIDEAEGWTNPPSVDFLRLNQNLIIDTKHFSNTFKFRLLESIPDLDGQTNGVMIWGDNYHALSFLKAKYAKSVQSVYIDPPYNADATAILYKNGYRNSSWCAMIHNRIALARELMKPSGIICITIDDYELYNLKQVADVVFPNAYIATVAIRNNPSGRSTVVGFSVNHEYALFYGKESGEYSVGRMPHSDEQLSRYGEIDENGQAYEWENLRKSSADSMHADRPKQYFPVYVDTNTLQIRIPAMRWNSEKNGYDVDEEPQNGESIVYPIDDFGRERVWGFGIDRIQKESTVIKAQVRNGKMELYKRKYLQTAGVLPRTWWDKPEYSARDNGTRSLVNLFGGDKDFDFPKSVAAVVDSIKVTNSADDGIILDFYSGSGTTGEAVIEINRNSEASNRKYILVEMGEYFDTVTKPRVQKVVYSDDWKDGKPQNRNTGISQIIKYMRLESYEDALSNIELSDNGGQLKSLLGEDYLIHYMVDLESRGSLLDMEAFSNPFAYTMKITDKNECKERPVDLVETFNYLIGLTVTRQSAISYWLSKPAEYPAYEGAVELVSDISGQYAFRQIEGTLPDGRRALVIWRSVTDDIVASNAALDAYFTTYRNNAEARKYDVIFVNGDSNLENLRGKSEGWTVRMTETEFKKRMFEEA